MTLEPDDVFDASMVLPKYAQVEGTVRIDGGSVVSGGQVYLAGGFTGGNIGVDGSFSFQAPPGTYRLSVPGGFYGAEGFAYEAGAAAPLTVTEDGVDLDIVLPPTHYLRGRITGGTVALANAEVDVFLDGWPFTHGFTASDGTYAIAVPPGAYVVGVYDPGKKYAQGFVGASGYVSDPGLAKLVGVGLADVTGVNLSLPSMKRISGKVLRGSSTSVVPYVFVEAFVNDRFFASQYATSSGTFNLPVTPGKVTLWVYDTDLWGAPGWRTSTGITANRASAAVTTVSTANVSGIVIREAQAVLWRANLWWVPAPGSQASVPGGVEAIAYGEAASFDIQDGSGNRYLPLLKASYRFWIESDEGAYSLADGWYKSGGTVTPDYAQALVKAVTTSGTLTVTVPQGVEVAGSVSDGVVGLDAVDVQVWSNGAFFTDKVVNTGFDFTLAAGTYRLAFVDLYDHHLTGWLGDDGFVYDYADARDIVVASDWVQNLNVTLPMGPPPSSPAGVSATPFHASAAVSFSPVPTGLTRPILHYAVTASPGGRQCITTTTSCTVTGLADGTPYTFTVTASSMTGPSAPSIASAAVTPRARPRRPDRAHRNARWRRHRRGLDRGGRQRVRRDRLPRDRVAGRADMRADPGERHRVLDRGPGRRALHDDRARDERPRRRPGRERAGDGRHGRAGGDRPGRDAPIRTRDDRHQRARIDRVVGERPDIRDRGYDARAAGRQRRHLVRPGAHDGDGDELPAHAAIEHEHLPLPRSGRRRQWQRLGERDRSRPTS